MFDLRRKAFGVLAVVALAFALEACGDGVTEPPPPMFDNPSTVRVKNRLMGPVLFFYARACGTTEWGADLLPLHPIEGTIQPGADRDFTVEAGCYDLRAEHLASTEPGPLVEKTTFDQVASPVTPLVWELNEIAGGPN